MRILIFGCGYLGRRAANSWLAEGNEVFAVTRSQENAETFLSLGIQPIVADICELDSLRDLPEADLVLNAVGFDRKSGRSHEEVTCGGLRNILAAITGKSSRLLHISSTSVYGQSAGEWVDEDSLCQPTQPGGLLCLDAERMVWDWVNAGRGISANVLRLAGIYGPARLLSRIEALQAGTSLVGRGDSWLNLIHVDDAVTALLACERRGPANETYVVVDDQPIQRSAYFELLASLINAPKPTFDSDQPSPRGSGGVNKRCSNRKLRDTLGWHPAYASIMTGLPHAIECLGA